MHRFAFTLICVALACGARADENDKPFGIAERVPLTTSRVIGSPDPPLPYRPVRAYPDLKLSFPIAIDGIPNSDQLLLIAQEKSYGPATIVRITDHPSTSQTELALNVPGGGTAYGICFH